MSHMLLSFTELRCVCGVMSLWKVLLFCLPLYICTETLERVSLSGDQSLTCGQGIIDCEVKPGSCIGHDEYVYVSSLDVYIVLCQTQEKTWSLCLKILMNITVRGQSVDVELVGNTSGDEEAEKPTKETPKSIYHEDEDSVTAAIVCVYYTNPSLSESKILHFTFLSSAFDGSTTLQVWMSLVVEIREADLGSPVTVFSLYTNSTKHVTISTPSKEEVCSKVLDVVFCKDGPRLRRKIDHVTGAIKLYVVDADKERFQTFQACQKLEREGNCLKVEWNDPRRDFEIALSSVAPCLCFEIWGDFPRKMYCPFLNETVISDSSVSVSVSATEIQESTESDTTALIWSLTAPCRLETELWLCRKGSWPDSSCHQINTTHHVHKFKNDRWITTDIGQWKLDGVFLKVERNSLLCVQVKVRGMNGYLGPVCPFEVNRAHWSFPLLVCVLLMCLSVLAAHAVQGALKSWVLRWLKLHDINSAAGSAEVLLVNPPDADHSLTELVCRLSPSLSSLGFNVSLDLWSRSELNALGPVPWLHSHLDQVQICGGRAVLILNQTTCERAKEWVRRGKNGRCEQKEVKNSDSNTGDCGVNTGSKSSACWDVFNASLSCVLADYLLGHAGKRFILAQFEAQPPGVHVPSATFPEFFQGLQLFNLPSQSLGFLMELADGAHAGRGLAGRWMRSRALRAAAQTLSGTLTDCTGHNSETEEDLEDVPLQQNQTSPQSSSDHDTKTNTINWI